MITRVFEAYIYAGRVLGNERVHLSPSQSVRGFQHAYNFRGKSAHIIVVSNDPNLSRDASLEFAAAIANERFTRFTVSFDEYNAQVKAYRQNITRKGKKNE